MVLNNSVLKLPGMCRLLSGYGLSVIADTSVYIVFAVWAKQITGSTSGIGLVFFCFIIPSLISPLTGNVIDSLKKDRMIVLTNLFMAVSILLLHYSDKSNQYLLLLFTAFIYGLGYVVFNAARICLVVNNYEERFIGKINAVLRTLREALRLSSPILGIYIYTTFGSDIFVYFVSLALLLSCLLFYHFEKSDNSERNKTDTQVKLFSLNGLMKGVYGLWKDRLLRVCITCLSVTLLVAGFYEMILFSILDNIGKPTSLIGQLISVQGLGAVIGGICSIKLIRRFTPAMLVSLGFIIQSIGILGLFVQDISITYISCAIFGFGAPVSMVGLDTIIQTTLPADIQGRANTSLEAVTSIPFSLSFLLSSVLTTLISYKLMLFFMVIVTLSASVYLLFNIRKHHLACQHSRDNNP
ncbi:Predicted arabinose efflux permease, MFS family [Xenorhabdus koppenhoeferi]|uniref:Predicted arabinose efflux permease, MFS family n=1 Tax=Xenorhabdus koppenhoeferi TaxID=351659 RepID=A0A1I7H3Y2_9GAMM|nr:Predicted arabinose efflux permease, MFS family [Xenorhabdus koppenhoeferi]